MLGKHIKNMKTISTIFALVAFASSTIFANTEATSSNKAQHFAIGVYQGKGTQTMHIMVDKEVGNRVSILVKDHAGRVIHQEYITKKTATYHGKFDFSEATEGTYQIEITDGKETLVKQIHISNTQATATNRTLTYEF